MQDNSHPAIIEPDKFDLVQTEIEKRCRQGSKLSNNSPFTTRIVCGDCGGYFGHKVFHVHDKFRTDAWRCNQRFKGDKVCETPILKDYEIKKAFVDALVKILQQKDAYITLYTGELERLQDLSKLQDKRNKAEEQLQDAIQELHSLIRQNMTVGQDQKIYADSYERLKSVVDERKLELEKAKSRIIEQTAKKEKLRRFMRGLESCGTDEPEYSDELFMLMVDRIMVNICKDARASLVFEFSDGTEITVRIEK